MKYLPEFVYGSLDGIITTSAIVASAASANLDRRLVILLGFANVIADGFSMASANYLSERVKKNPLAIRNAFVTFLSFVTIGSIPVLPFLFVASYRLAIISVFVAMFFIGFIKGHFANDYGQSIMETLFVGGSATTLSYIISRVIAKNERII